jgi:endoglucanase
MFWYNGPWGGGQPGNSFYTESNISSLANNWGANLVRAAIGHVYESRTYLYGPLSAIELAKNMMDWADRAGIYVIIDNHSHDAHRPGHEEAAKTFFRDVSAYVKSNGYNHVLYEIYNEPVCDWDQLNTTNCGSAQRTRWWQIKSYAETIIPIIRESDPNGIIIVGTPNFSSQIDSARIDPLDPGRYHNIMYGFHYYAGSHMGYQSRFKNAYCGGENVPNTNNFINDGTSPIPIFITEWGTTNADGKIPANSSINFSNNNSWMSLVEGAKVSWANWSLSASSDAHSALTSADVSGTTTESGTIVKNWIKEFNADHSVAGVNPETIACNFIQ